MKKSILVTFSVLIISLCEVKTSCIPRSLSLCSYKIKGSICQNILYLSKVCIYSIVDLFIFFNLMYAICNNLDEL